MRDTLRIDLETYSGFDLKKVGVYRYAEHPDFQVMLFGYKFVSPSGATTPTNVIDLTEEELPIDLALALNDESIIKTAFNANFERVCLAAHLKAEMPAEQWRCTMVHALYLGLPGSLDQVGRVLKANIQKSPEGRALIRYFCMPCKPTKKNGMRTRNLPRHDPARWELFKKYCGSDVDTEESVALRLAKQPVPDIEWHYWTMSQRMSDKGVLVDRDLVAHALQADEEAKEELTAEAVELTGLQNPNSVAQLKAWLTEELDEDELALAHLGSLTKKSIPKIINLTDDEKVKRVLELRLELGRASVKKYQAIDRAVCNDGRIRGTQQFYGANRTGRDAGRIVQLQNMMSNKLPDLDLCRRLLKNGDYDLLKLFFGSVSFSLAQLIRTALIAEVTKVLAPVDFSAIEARGLAWAANEEWRMEVFRTHGMIYEASASSMFKVPMDSIVKMVDGKKIKGPNFPLRQKGKVAELACLVKDTPVLTARGKVPIQEVRPGDKVWDGVSWVSCEGAVSRGTKSTIEYQGLRATPDHLVWVEGSSRPVHLGVAAACRAQLRRSEPSGPAVRLGQDREQRDEIGRRKPLRQDPVHRMRRQAVDRSVDVAQGQDPWLPGVLAASTGAKAARPRANRREAAVHQSERQRLQELRSARRRVSLWLRSRCGAVGAQELAAAAAWLAARSNQQRRPLRAWQLTVVDSASQQPEQTNYAHAGMAACRLALQLRCGGEATPRRAIPRRDTRQGAHSGAGEAKELAWHPAPVEVFDILNAGPRNRFTANGVLVHNCGFWGGANALVTMGALEMGLKMEELQPIVDAWRAANPKIKAFTYAMQKAAMRALRTGLESSPSEVDLEWLGWDRNPVPDHGTRFRVANGLLIMRLPSGRDLFYVKPRIEHEEGFGDGITYEGVDQKTRQWVRLRTYGGKLVENWDQAFCRDILYYKLAEMEREELYDAVRFHVHDEAVSEIEPGRGVREKIQEIFGRPIPWAPGLPLRGDGFETPYYLKDD